MDRVYLRITTLFNAKLNVVRMNQGCLERYIHRNCSQDEHEVTDWLRDVSVGDDISIYRDNNKECVIVRVQ